MDLKSLSRRDGSNTGTVVGIVFVIVAVLGTRFLDWEWSAFPNQPVPLAIGVIAAVIALSIAYQKMNN